MGIPGRIGLVSASLLVALAWAATEVVPLNHEAVKYTQAQVNNDVTLLQKRLEKREVELKANDTFGYLPSLLAALEVPVESQILVFSKTSFQAARINPVTPRAIFFNDRVSIGYVAGGDVLEIAAQDPKQGTIFYTLDQDPQAAPAFVRRDDACLQCHVNHSTSDVPGLLIRSVYPEPSGMPFFQAGGFITDHRSPLEERWGGWFVTGKHGKQQHMGNAFARDRSHPDQLDKSASLNRTDLPTVVRRENYLSPHSDIVALMVAEHQFRGLNLITRLNFESRLAIHQRELMARLMGEPSAESVASAKRRISRQGDELVDYLLLKDEAALTEPVAGTSDFTRVFQRTGPFDGRQRSLRQLDLERRLFRHRLSYLVYSPAFKELPKEALDYVCEKLAAALSASDSRLPADERRAITEILLATKSDLPDALVTRLSH